MRIYASLTVNRLETRPEYYRQKKSTAKTDAGEPRYTVGLPSALARRVERYAGTVDASMSKAIATLVRLGLESQEER
jgi:hypothetical protein